MNLSAIYHKSSDNFCYALNKNQIVINIRTGKDIDRVVLHYGDPFTHGIMGGHSAWTGEALEMTDKIKLRHNYIWSATVSPEFKRCRYYFQIFSGDEDTYFIEDGFLTKEQMDSYTDYRQDFFFPWLNPADVYAPPAWVNETVWYQIFPERFCNGNPDISPDNVKSTWGSSTTVVNYIDFYGGDIEGITSKLDYLQDLGITGLYLTPINLAPTNHKYDTADYYKIDPHFGDVETVKTFVREAHSRGIRVMFDGVFNHSGAHFDKWEDVKKNGPASPYYDWFMVNSWPFSTEKGYGTNARKGNFYTFGFFDNMPKLNTNNPDVIKYFLDVCTYWVDTFDIDAIRLDVANEVSHTFCKALRKQMDSLKDDFFILGEIWHDSTSWLRGDEFDSVMNYTFQSSVNDLWMNTDYTKDDFEYSINKCYSMYPKQTNNVLFNLLDSHDTIRLVTKLGNIDKFYQQMTVIFTMPGTVCIYYGTEVALEGKHDPDCRRCMPWAEIENGDFDDRINNFKNLISLRKNLPQLRSSTYHFNDIADDPRIISYIKSSGDSSIQVILNCSEKDFSLNVDNEHILFTHLYDNNLLRSNGSIIYSL